MLKSIHWAWLCLSKVGHESSLVRILIHPMALLATKVAGVISLVSWERGGQALLEVLDMSMTFGSRKGGRWFIDVFGMCGRRPLAHTLGFLVPSFGKVTDVSVGKSFAVEVGSSSGMLHKSNLLELIFESRTHGNKGVWYISLPLPRRKPDRMLEQSWWSQMPAVVWD